MAGVGSERLGDDQQRIGEGIDTPLRLALDRLLEGIALEVSSTGDLEGTSTRDDALVNDHIVDAAEAITNGIGDLGDGMGVGTLDHEGDGLGVLDVLDEGVLLLAELLLVDEAGPAQHVGGQILDAVLGDAAADELQALHVAALGAAQGEDAVLGQDVEGQGVDALLVDDDEALLGVAAADLVLELDDLLQLGVDEAPLALHQLVPLLGARVVEARVDLRLLVLQADVHRQDVRVLQPLRHVRVPRAVVQGQAADQLRLRGRPVLHLHDLHHVQVGLRGGLVDGQDGVHDVGGELLG